jgi:hypothetical protein
MVRMRIRIRLVLSGGRMDRIWIRRLGLGREIRIIWMICGIVT